MRDHEDKSAQAKQKAERTRLINAGKTPKEASRLAKIKFPLPNSQAKRKNRQPRGGAEPPGQTGGGRRNPFTW